jgi:hypothetical protein
MTAGGFQLLPEGLEIVNLPVECNPKAIVLIGHGLPTPREINDG